MIRKATISDINNIAKLIVFGWKTAYKGLIDDSFLNTLSINSIEDNWSKAIINQNTDDNIYVYEENNKILAIIRFGKPINSDPKYDSEIHALYVEPSLKGNGIGTKLLNYAKNYFIENGKKNMVIWCLNGNIPTIKFYEKRGGNLFGTRKAIVNNIELEEVGFEYTLN